MAGDDIDDELRSSYSIPAKRGPESPIAICERLLRDCHEFAHLAEGEAKIAFLIAAQGVIIGERRVLGMAHLPTVQGRLKGVFNWALREVLGFDPDFIVTLDEQYWQASTPRAREILVYHELCHCAQKRDRDGELRWTEDGLPVWGIVGHDVEEFEAVVERYGAYSADIREFVSAVERGEVAQEQ